MEVIRVPVRRWCAAVVALVLLGIALRRSRRLARGDQLTKVGR
jgi:hypothetical protein